MGTREEENAARQEQEQRATQARLDFIQAQKDMAERQRQQEEADRKAAEDKLVNGTGSGQMVAADPATPNWPDDGFQAETAGTGRLDAVKGALGMGPKADADFAAKLLRSGQAPLGGATAPAKGADGAVETTGGAVSPAVKPALGL
jgi:type II secretory pathway pseudopilin PulG